MLLVRNSRPTVAIISARIIFNPTYIFLSGIPSHILFTAFCSKSQYNKTQYGTLYCEVMSCISAYEI